MYYYSNLTNNNTSNSAENDSDCIETLRADKARQRFLQSRQNTEPRTINTVNGGNGIPGASSREGSSSFCTINTVNDENGIPCYFQAEPRLKETYWLHKRNSTHSSSRESYDNWARKQGNILLRKNQNSPPDYFATIKFRFPITLKQYSKFWEVLRHGFADQSRKYNLELAGWWVLAVEPNNTFHNHVLIRTKIVGAEGIIRRAIDKASVTVFGSDLVYLKWIEPVQTIEGSAWYSVKLRQHFRIVFDDETGEYKQTDKVLLFKQEYRKHIVGQFGKYFTVAEKEELGRETIEAIEDYNRTCNSAFISEHPELLPEIQSNSLYAYAIQDDNSSTLDDITTNITTNMRKSYRDITLETATKSQRQEAKEIARHIQWDFDLVLLNLLNYEKAQEGKGLAVRHFLSVAC